MDGLWTPGKVSHVQGAQLEQVLQNAQSRLVVVDWFAPWCGPCRRIAPFYEELAARYTAVVFVSVDTEAPLNKSAMLAMRYQIRAFPTFSFHLQNVEKERFSGADPNKLEGVVTRLMAAAEDAQLADALRMSMSVDGTGANNSNNNSSGGQSTGGGNSAEVNKAELMAALDKADAEDPEPEGDSSISLRAKRTTGAVIELSVSAKASAQHLRRKVARELEAAPESLRIIFRGKIILDKHTLASYGITEDGLTVHVAVSGKASSANKPSAAPSPAPSVANRTSDSPAAPGVAALRSALQDLERKNGRTNAKDAVQVMLLYVRNVIKHPEDVKFRSIRQGNAKFSSKIAACAGGLDCMKALGFDHAERNGEPYLVLRSEESVEVMKAREEELRGTIDRLAPASSFPSSSGMGGMPSAAPSAAGAGPSGADPFGFAGSGAGNPFAGFAAPGNNFASMFGGMNMPGGGFGAGGLPGMSPEMLQQFQNNPQMQSLSMNMMQRLMQDPELMTSITQAMSSGQDPMMAMASNPRLMETMMSMMSDPSVMSSLSGAVGQARQQPFPFNSAPSNAAAAPPPFTTSSAAPSSGTSGAGNASSGNSASNNNEDNGEDEDLDDIDDIYAD
ncbi:Thioredoxin [Hondaea fermentalgiana]|uniref:Thioredoxin n=1 Tax=Hondaea fermentalgiana TaxID=2315210 RepID=A0A2R5GG56_9STRA|nr:Thioredoxin [Hondaea fermentalgiana]|eukprot:GBG29867.1 Thioredoxin [Hondaea fermentalgiana]